MDPWERPDINTLVKQVEQLASTLSVNPTEPLPPDDMELLTGNQIGMEKLGLHRDTGSAWEDWVCMK